jgi:hypothetical protein
LKYLTPSQVFYGDNARRKKIFWSRKEQQEMLSRKFTWWCFGGFFKIFFRGESLAVFGSGGLKGGVHYNYRTPNQVYRGL